MLLASGPLEARTVVNVLITGNPDMFPFKVVRPPVGLKAYRPLKAPGTLKLPPMSVPIDRTAHLEATRPASPPDEPPQVLVLSCGFYAVP